MQCGGLLPYPHCTKVAETATNGVGRSADVTFGSGNLLLNCVLEVQERLANVAALKVGERFSPVAILSNMSAAKSGQPRLSSVHVSVTRVPSGTGENRYCQVAIEAGIRGVLRPIL